MFAVRKEAPVKILLPSIGLIIGLGVGLACSRSIQGEDPEYQKRIDKHCATACSMHMECTVPHCADPAAGCEGHADDTYDGCFDECSKGKWWWQGSDDCKDARWAFYDCQTSITSCDVWILGVDANHPCGAAKDAETIECQGVTDEN